MRAGRAAPSSLSAHLSQLTRGAAGLMLSTHLRLGLECPASSVLLLRAWTPLQEGFLDATPTLAATPKGCRFPYTSHL